MIQMPSNCRNLQRRPYSRPGTGSRWSRYSHASPRVPHQRRPKHPPPPSGSPRVGPPRSGGRWSGCSVDCLSGFFREKGSRHGDEIGDFRGFHRDNGVFLGDFLGFNGDSRGISGECHQHKPTILIPAYHPIRVYSYDAR